MTKTIQITVVLLSFAVSVFSDAFREGGIAGLRGGRFGGNYVDLSGTGGRTITRRVITTGGGTGTGTHGLQFIRGSSGRLGLGGGTQTVFISGRGSGGGIRGIELSSGRRALRFIDPLSARFGTARQGSGGQTIRTFTGSGGFGSNFFGAAGGSVDVNNFGDFLDTRAFGIVNFAPGYVAIENFDFDSARQGALQLAPAGSIIPGQAEQVVIGRRFRSGYARQTETSGALRSGAGSGESGIDLAATRSAKQDATQQFSQTASGDGSTGQGSGYQFSSGNSGQIRFQPVQLEPSPVHSGPRAALPVGVRG